MPQLKDFQREDVDYIKKHGLKVLLASAPGTGKTCIAIRALAETYMNSLPALVVCPASVIRHWGREVHRWAPGVRALIVDDSHTPLPRIPQSTVLIMSWALLDVRWTDLAALGIKAIVADEAHYGKNPNSLRSQALYQLARKVGKILLVTGTPIINTRSELNALSTLLGTENPPMIRRLLEDVAPEIPKKSRSYLHINLPDHIRTEYDKAEDDFASWLTTQKERLLGEGMASFEVERVMAAEALAKIGYLRRLTGVGKVAAASAWIAKAIRLGEPVVVFVEHQPVLRALLKRLKKQRIRHVVVEGKTPSKHRQFAVDAFQANEYPVFIGSKAAKEGITLTAARHLLFLERYFTSSEEEQAEDRIRRIGQTHATTIWFLHAIDTVDDRIESIVKTKRKLIRSAIGSADVAETPTGNVLSLIQHWNDHTSEKKASFSEEELPPLPKARDVQSIVFHGERWTTRSSAAWCKMNGYTPYKAVQLNNRIQLMCVSAGYFKSGEFESISIAKDIKVIMGKRLSQANERRVRASRIKAR